MLLPPSQHTQLATTTTTLATTLYPLTTMEIILSRVRILVAETVLVEAVEIALLRLILILMVIHRYVLICFTHIILSKFIFGGTLEWYCGILHNGSEPQTILDNLYICYAHFLLG